jgi:hypothetical protein
MNNLFPNPMALRVDPSPPLDIPTSSTISQLCARHRFGRTSYFKLRKEGLGPKELRHGRLVRITAEAEREWLNRMQVGTGTDDLTIKAGHSLREVV